jgi:GNAT superfamily N-acetyltransferase
VSLGISRAVTQADLDLVERFYGSRRVATKVDITPTTDPTLSRITHERGYHVADLTSVLLLQVRDAAIEPAPDVLVRWARPEDCEVWVDTIAQNFYVSDPGKARRKSIACVFHAPHALNVIAMVNGEVAGVAGMMVPHGGGIAVIYGSCTFPQFRRMGVHREMLRLRVETARSAGCSAVMATALPGSDSERNLTRCGFELCYVKTSWAK